MSSQGWISLHRRIQNHWIWADPEKLRAWLDLILMANHSPARVLIGATLVEIPRGSFVTSQRKLCHRWTWNRDRLTTFKKLLQEDGMALFKPCHNHTQIYIINYDSYQDTSSTNQSTEHTTEGSTKGSTKGSMNRSTNHLQTIRTNNDQQESNNEKQDTPLPPKQGELVKKEKFPHPARTEYAAGVWLTESDYLKLCSDWNKPVVDSSIAEMSDYQLANGKKYKDYSAALRNWMRRKNSMPQKTNGTHQQQQIGTHNRPGYELWEPPKADSAPLTPEQREKNKALIAKVFPKLISDVKNI